MYSVRCQRGRTSRSRAGRFHKLAHLSFVLGRADMTFLVIEVRRQRASYLIIRADPVWANLF